MGTPKWECLKEVNGDSLRKSVGIPYGNQWELLEEINVGSLRKSRDSLRKPMVLEEINGESFRKSTQKINGESLRKAMGMPSGNQ